MGKDQARRKLYYYISKVNFDNLYSDFHLNYILIGKGVFPTILRKMCDKSNTCRYNETIEDGEHVISFIYILYINHTRNCNSPYSAAVMNAVVNVWYSNLL